MIGVDFRLTLVIVTVKLADELLAGTSTVTGTVARLELLLSRFTDKPPAGAAAVRATVPVDVAPPITVGGLSVNDARVTDPWGGNKLIAVDFVMPL